MPTQRHSWRIEAAQKGVRLDHFLAEALPRVLGREVSRGQVRKLIMAGAASLNGRRERIASLTLQAGARVEAFVDLSKLDSSVAHGIRRPKITAFEWTAARVLFEDESLVVIDKPAGLPTQPTLDPARDNVFAGLKRFLAARDGRPPYLGLHHRLDCDTSGVLLLTKDPKANAGVSGLFTSRAVEKTYLALCVAGGPCPEAWEVKNYLGAVSKAGKATRFGAVNKGGDPAQTAFRVIERLAGALLVEARPHTGRTHQIRVHLSEAGRPLLGDAFYGGPAEWRTAAGGRIAIPRVMLHAAALEFRHPLTGADLAVRSPLPGDFSACLRQLH